MRITHGRKWRWQLITDQNGVEVWPMCPLGCGLNQGQGQGKTGFLYGPLFGVNTGVNKDIDSLSRYGFLFLFVLFYYLCVNFKYDCDNICPK